MSTTLPSELIRGNVKAVMKTVGASSADLWNVKPSEIKFLDGFNLRQHNDEYEEHIKWLTDSIMANGYYQDKPIAGFVAEDPAVGNVIFCTDGHSRVTAVLRAIKLGAPIEAIPMVIKPKGTTMEDLTVALVTSNEGKPFSPLEKGLAIKRLIEMGMSEVTIAKKLSLTVPYVGDLLNLVGAPKIVRDMVANNQVSATAAVTTLKKHGVKAGEKLQAGLEAAQAAGKTKVTAKHLKSKKAVNIKLKGEIKKGMDVGASTITILLDDALELAINAGDRVRLTIIQGDEEL